MRYIRALIRARRAAPRDDLVSALVRVEEAGEGLDEDELLAMIFLLLVAGHETTVHLIGNGMLALLEHPDQLARLRDDPALIRPAVEELLRYASPVETATERYALEDVTVAGTTIPRVAGAGGDRLRQPRRAPVPEPRHAGRGARAEQASRLWAGDTLLSRRPAARMEGQIAIRTLLRRLPDLRLAVAAGALRWRRGLIVRGLEGLPLAFGG